MIKLTGDIIGVTNEMLDKMIYVHRYSLCRLFLNGIYFGMYFMREEYDLTFLKIDSSKTTSKKFINVVTLEHHLTTEEITPVSTKILKCIDFGFQISSNQYTSKHTETPQIFLHSFTS